MSSAEPVSRWTPAWTAAVVVLGALAGWLHWQAGPAFPQPWPDESHFLAPALQLSQHFGLAVPQLNAPTGIFWMPTGYYVLLAPLLRIAPNEALEIGRLSSVVAVVACAATLLAVGRRLQVPLIGAAGTIAAWLCMPRVVAAANIVRMEAVILALAAGVIWLLAADRWPLALTAALVAPLVHPVGLVLPVVVIVAWFLRAERRPWTTVERVLLGAVTGLWIAELAYFWVFAEATREHLGFQLTRKAGRDLSFGIWHGVLLPPLIVAGAVLTWQQWRRAGPTALAVWACLALAGAFAVVDVIGHEVWYGVLGRETAVLLLVLAAMAMIARLRPRLLGSVSGSTAVGVLSTAAVAAGLVWTLGHGWFFMRPDPAANAEWDQFVGASLAMLHDLDEVDTDPATVYIDPLSGFGQEVFARSWRRLRFVQPTPATPLSLHTADYLLVTPGARYVTEELPQQWAQRPILQVDSAHRRFGMQVFDNPRRGG